MAVSLIKKIAREPLSKNFVIGEYFPPEMIEKYGRKVVQFLHPDVVSVDEELRLKFGPCEINNWLFGGTMTQRGVRDFDGIGAGRSAHKCGMASDKIFKTPANAVRKWIAENAELLYIQGLRRVEEDVSWIHTDIYDDRSGRVQWFNP